MNISNFKITVFGDSISVGIVTDDGKLGKVSENAISLIGKHFGVDICNKSAFGMTLSRLTQKGIVDKYIKEEADPTLQRIAVLALGGNDADFDWTKVQQNPSGEHLQKTPLSQFGDLLVATIQKLRNADIIPVLVTLPPMNPVKYIESLSKIVDNPSMMVFLHDDVFFMYKDQERYSSEILRVAFKTNCALFDLRSSLLMEKDYNKMLCRDGIHLNQEGQRKIATAVINAIENNEILGKR